MNTNKTTIIGSIIIITLILVIPTTYKVIKNYRGNIIKIAEQKIIESAKNCYYEEKCIEEKMTLKELYDKEYLPKMVNPITKEYYNDNCYVEKDDENFKFIDIDKK